MQRYTGLGCWPGKAEGRIRWVEPVTAWDRTPLKDRAAEIARLKAAMADALATLDHFQEQQATLEGKIQLQQYREALQDPAFTGRVTMLIDLHGLPAPTALVEAAGLVAGVMARSEDLADRARALPETARWLARRLSPAAYPADAVLAAQAFSPLELLDRTHPALMAAGEPGVIGEAPLIWGLSDLDPSWEGLPVRLEGQEVALLDREAEPEAGAPEQLARPHEVGVPAQANEAEAEAEVTPVTAESFQAERRAVLETARRMKRDGLVRLTSGNVSCRIPGTNLFAITPSGMDYDLLEPEDICILDLSGQVMDGRRRPSTEWALHRLTYVRRPDLSGVVHTHSIYASAFACTAQDLPVVSTELAGLVGGTIRCAPYAKAGTAEFAETALHTLGQEDVAVLFQNHGVMAAGHTLQEAYDIAVGIEEAAMIYYIARAIGQPVILPEEERRRIYKVMHTSYGQPAREA